jgi:hypothetical protein
MVAPTWRCTIQVLNKTGNVVQPVSTTDTGQPLYQVNPTDYISYEVQTFADNGKLASDKFGLIMMELNQKNEDEEPTFQNVYDITMNTDSNGYKKGTQRIPNYLTGKIVLFALTYGYDNSSNISDYQKKKEGREKMAFGVVSAVGIAAIAAASIGLAPFTGGGSLAGLAVVASSPAFVVAEVAVGTFIYNRHLLMGNIGENKYGNKFPEGGYYNVIGMGVESMPEEAKRERLLNVVMLGTIVTGFMAVRSYLKNKSIFK